MTHSQPSHHETELSLDDRFEKAISRFSNSLSDLRELSELVESLIKKHKLKELESALARYDGLGEALCNFDTKLKSDISLIQHACEEVTGQSEGTLVFEVDDHGQGKKVLTVAGNSDDLKEFDKSISTILKSDKSVQHLHRSSLISLVSVTEVFLSQLLHLFFQKHPSAVNAKDKQFTFEELTNFSTIDEARAYLVSWKIENIIRGSYEDWYDYLKNNFKLELSGTVKHHNHLVEHFQRRNLFVHNDGVVNKIYLSKVDKSLAKPDMLTKKFTVSKGYLFAALDRFEAVFLQIAFELWMKCDKTSEKRSSFIVHSAYDALLNKRWRVATEVATFIEKDKAADEVTILMAKVNSWIARKNIEDKSLVMSEVKAFDVSAKDGLFKLAKHCLLEETDAALSLAKQLEKSKQISLDDLLEWPLFVDLRATPKMDIWLKQLQLKTTKNIYKKVTAKSKENKGVTGTSEPKIATKKTNKGKTITEKVSTNKVPKQRKKEIANTVSKK